MSLISPISPIKKERKKTMSGKKLFGVYTFLAGILMLAGCTLYMEEPPEIPEAERGFGEPYTEKTASVEVSYQSHDGVKSFTESMGDEYIVMVEGDSVAYFSDSTPEELVPYVGDKVFALECKATPFGLMGIVTKSERANGLIRVELQGCAIDDVFKDLEIKANVRATTDERLIGSDTLALDDPDRVSDTYIDFPSYGVDDSEMVGYDDEGNLISDDSTSFAPPMRDEEDKDEENKYEGDSWHEEIPDMDDEYVFDTRAIIGQSPEWLVDFPTTQIDGMDAKKWVLSIDSPKWAKPLMKFLKGVGETLKLAKPFITGDRYIRYTTKRTATVDVDFEFSSSKRYYKFVQDRKETVDVSVESGYRYKDKYYTQLVQGIDKEILGTGGVTVSIPFGMSDSRVICKIWGPFVLVGRISGKFNFNCDAIGRSRYIKETSKKTGMEMKNGVTTPIEENGKVTSHRHAKELNWVGQMNANVQIGGSLGAGVGVKGKTSDGDGGIWLSVGCEEEYGFNIRAGENATEIDNVAEQKICEENNYYGPYVTKRYFLEGGIKLSDWYSPNDRTTLKEEKVLDLKWPVYPQVDSNSPSVRFDTQYGVSHDTEKAIYTMKFKKPGELISTMGNQLTTFVRVYRKKDKKKIGDFKSGMMGMLPEVVDVDMDKKYTYEITGLDSDELYYAVPCVTELVGDRVHNYEYDKNPYYFAASSPAAFLLEEPRKVWEMNYQGVYVATNRSRTSDPVELVEAKYYGLSGGEYWIGINAAIMGVAKCSSWGVTVRFHNEGIKDYVKDVKISGKSADYYRILVKNASKQRPVSEVTVTPFCYIINEKGKAEKWSYNDEAVTITVNNTMEGSHDYGYDNHYMFDL